MLKSVKSVFGKSGDADVPEVNIIPRSEHSISREDISANALKVLYRLNGAGFQAHLVGGCVRDLMLGLHPKDFDVVTDATPEQIKGLFKNCRLIGRRFRLAHIVFGREIIEVATFRGHHETTGDKQDLAKKDKDGLLLRDNVFGSIEEDAQRRDFTFNAMYYNVADYTIRDFANGEAAIEKREVELIGDPEVRYREDPVRMLRAVRFAAKLSMTISPGTAEPITKLAHLLNNIPPARLFEETLKLFLSGKGLATFELMLDYQLVPPLFPQLTALLNDKNSKEYQFIRQVLINTDNRINSGQRVTPAFLYAALLWYPLEEHAAKLMAESGLTPHDAFNIAINDVIHRQTQRIMIPKRFSTVIRDIWILQQRLPRRFGRRAYQLVNHPKFRAGYDFLLIRGQIEGGSLHELADWWTDFQHADAAKQKSLLNALRKQEGGNSNRPRRKKRKPRQEG